MKRSDITTIGHRRPAPATIGGGPPATRATRADPAPAAEWCLVLEEDRRPDLLVVPMTDGIARVIVDERSLVLAAFAALLADTPAGWAFLEAMDGGTGPVPDFPPEGWESDPPPRFLSAIPIGPLPAPDIDHRWIREAILQICEHAERAGHGMPRSPREFKAYAERVFNEAVPGIFVGIVCDGAVASRRALEEAARMIGAGVQTWPMVLHGAILTVQEMADRCPKLEAVIQKTQYRREDAADRQGQLDSQAAAMRDSKRAKLVPRDEWIVGRYARERSKHQAGEYGNVPAMEAVIDQWNREGIGRPIANVKTVRRILKARGIDPAAPDATP